MEQNHDRPENSLVGKFIRTRHNDRKAPLQVEPPRAAELSRIDADEAADRLAAGPTGRKRGWPKGKKRLQTRRTKLAVLGIPSGALDAGDPSYARCVRLASAYRKSRAKELAVSHGYVSSGASALLASAAMALSASRYLYEKAASGGDEMGDILKTAAKLADSARQNELAAWELCAREAVARKKFSAISAGTPWMVEDDSGYAKLKPGPKKRSSDLPELPPIGSHLDGFIQSAKIEDKVVEAEVVND